MIARKVFNLNPNAIIILCGAVTFADENKGISYLAEAIKKISGSVSENDVLELILFGKKSAENISFGIKTTELGYIYDARLLRIVYSLADVMVVPSLQESFGLTALEAMSCGTPVVAFAATGLLDIVDHKKNGYLAIPYKADDLATGIRWCLGNNRQNELSENARKKVIECFSLKLAAQKYYNLYNTILGS
jgi:glycosyltransferase involved in cell wall biosynthesis